MLIRMAFSHYLFSKIFADVEAVVPEVRTQGRPRLIVVRDSGPWIRTYDGLVLSLKQSYSTRHIPIAFGVDLPEMNKRDAKHGAQIFKSVISELLDREDIVYVLAADHLDCLEKTPDCIESILKKHPGKTLVLFFQESAFKSLRFDNLRGHNSRGFDFFGDVDGRKLRFEDFQDIQNETDPDEQLRQIVEDKLRENGFQFPSDAARAHKGIREIINSIVHKVAKIGKPSEGLSYFDQDNRYVVDDETGLVFPPMPKISFSEWLQTDAGKEFVVKRGKNRQASDTKPFHFMNQVYRDYIDQNMLYSGHIREADPYLYDKLAAAAHTLPGGLSIALAEAGVKTRDSVYGGDDQSPKTVKLRQIIGMLQKNLKISA